MQPPEFFDRLRAEIVELRRAAPGAQAWWSETHVPLDYYFPDGIVPRFDELMTQAALGAGVTIVPGPTARVVWLQLLVEYGTAFNPSKLKPGYEAGRAKFGDGGEIIELPPTLTLIPDLFGIATDYLEHLKTRALADGLRSVQEPTVSEAPLDRGEHPDPVTVTRLELFATDSTASSDDGRLPIETSGIAESSATPAGPVDVRQCRQRLLQAFMDATGVDVQAVIFRAVRVHGSDWKRWKKDKLPAGSVITKRIEGFLTEMKPPPREQS